MDNLFAGISIPLTIMKKGLGYRGVILRRFRYTNLPIRVAGITGLGGSFGVE
jgi:hypothetical protein